MAEEINSSAMLSPTGFRLTINSEEFKGLEYFCIAAELPSITLESIEASFRNGRTPIPGDTISYQPLPVTFLVDDKLRNYIELFNWIYNNAHSNELIWRDMTFSILTNRNTTNKQVLFHNVIPSSLTGLEFNTQITDLEYLTCSVEFAYQSFEIV